MTQEGLQHWGNSDISLISTLISARLSQTSKFPVFGVSKITFNNSSLIIAVNSCFEKWSHIAPLLVSNYKLIIPHSLLIKSPKNSIKNPQLIVPQYFLTCPMIHFIVSACDFPPFPTMVSSPEAGPLHGARQNSWHRLLRRSPWAQRVEVPDHQKLEERIYK